MASFQQLARFSMRTFDGRGATGRGRGRILVLLLFVVGLASCDDGVVAPPLAGPSTLALSIDMGAVPSFLNADGISTSTITITVRDPGGKPVPGKFLFAQHDGDGSLHAASAPLGNLQTGISLATDANGVAQLVYRAGTAVDRLVTIRCEPYSVDAGFTGEVPRYVVIHQR
jgi:hypothetical protein